MIDLDRLDGRLGYLYDDGERVYLRFVLDDEDIDIGAVHPLGVAVDLAAIAYPPGLYRRLRELGWRYRGQRSASGGPVWEAP